MLQRGHSAAAARGQPRCALPLRCPFAELQERALARPPQLVTERRIAARWLPRQRIGLRKRLERNAVRIETVIRKPSVGGLVVGSMAHAPGPQVVRAPPRLIVCKRADSPARTDRTCRSSPRPARTSARRSDRRAARASPERGDSGREDLNLRPLAPPGEHRFTAQHTAAVTIATV